MWICGVFAVNFEEIVAVVDARFSDVKYENRCFLWVEVSAETVEEWFMIMRVFVIEFWEIFMR